MAFPVDADRQTTNGGASVTTADINLPANIAAGDLLIAYVRNATGGTVTWPAGWNEMIDESPDAADDGNSVAYKVADGTESGTIQVTFSTSGKYAAVCYRITGGGTPEISTRATGASTTPDPPSFSPSGGAKDYLWIWMGGWEGEQTTPPAGSPTNYSNAIGNGSGTAGVITTNCRVASATRQLNAATEDPPSWTISASDDWTAFVIAVPPAAITDAATVYIDIQPSGSEVADSVDSATVYFDIQPSGVDQHIADVKRSIPPPMIVPSVAVQSRSRW